MNQKAMLIPLFFISIISLSSCKKQEQALDTPRPAGKFNDHQLSARFLYDLGPAIVDVSNYPQKIQQDYKIFLAVCGSCHTSARPLNAPYIKAADWKRFVRRMHIKMQDRGFHLETQQEKEIVDFLVYDSKIRKIDREKEFKEQEENLKKLFEEVVREREKLLLEETKQKPKAEYPYVGVK